MRIATLFLSLAMAASLISSSSAAPIPKHLMKEKTEHEKLQGKWKLTSLTIGAIPANRIQLEMTLEITGDTLKATTKDLVTTATVNLHTTDGLKRLAMTNTRNFSTNGNPPPR